MRQSSDTVRTKGLLLVLACSVASGCGRSTTPAELPAAAQQDVSRRFAEAIFRGQGDAAVALLVHPADAALARFARRAARPWKAEHARVRLPGMRAGRRWIFRYLGRRTYRDGRFEEVRGDITVIVTASSGRTGVEFFALRNDDVRFSTHHDSLLLPSKR
jgi:hypothetical protein